MTTNSPDRPAPHRPRLTIPADDEVSKAWLAAQASVSASLRLLIREAMAAHGPIDALSRPLQLNTAQPVQPVQPARTATVRAADPNAQSGSGLVQALKAAARPAAQQVAPAPAPEAVQPAPQPAPAKQPEPAKQPAPTKKTESSTEGSGLTDVGAFLAASRD